VDGWIYDARNNTWKRNYSGLDNITQPWEGEDLNLNGRVDAGETNPSIADNDSDGLPDCYEKWFGLNPFSAVGVNGGAGDYDGDGLTNLEEYNYHTIPTSNDTDSDGLTDRVEVLVRYTNPWTNDTDADGLTDYMEIVTLGAYSLNPLKNDTDGDGVYDGFEMYETRAYEEDQGPGMDFDGDGLINAKDTDSDNDGIPDGIEFRNGTNKIAPVNRDTDGDGIPDGTEDANHNGVQDIGETDPLNPDTDNDGLWDGNYTIVWTSAGWTNFSIGEIKSGANALNP
jgi:hypothetical protein